MYFIVYLYFVGVLKIWLLYAKRTENKVSR